MIEVKTIKLYEKDAYLTECKAHILEQVEYKGKIGYILDQTVLYPTGGGQPNDLGMINNIKVLDVAIIEDEIVNFIEGKLEVGQEVDCKIDFERRFDHMQQHSGEHIISGVLCSLYNCDNVGFHLGKEEVVIDYNVDLNKEQIEEAERIANQAIYEDIKPDIFILDSDLDYRSKKELTGDIRIVKFGKYDCCACCGTHVHSAGEVGMILVTGFESVKKGTRIHILCGKRAYRYIKAMQEDTKKVSAMVSKPIGNLSEGVDKVLKDVENLRNELSIYKKEYLHSLAMSVKDDPVFYANDKLDPSAARILLNEWENKKAVFILYNGMFMYSADNVNLLLNALRKNYVVKGGGKNNFAQGKIEATIDQIKAVYQDL